MSGIDIRVVAVGDRELVTLGSFDDVTARMLLLFVFLIGGAASGSLRMPGMGSAISAEGGAGGGATLIGFGRAGTTSNTSSIPSASVSSVSEYGSLP